MDLRIKLSRQAKQFTCNNSLGESIIKKQIYIINLKNIIKYNLSI
jgi:hypothetical protein